MRYLQVVFKGMLGLVAEAVAVAGASLTGGLYAARPAVPTAGMMYFSTDRGSYGTLSVCIVDGAWIEEPPTRRSSGTLAARPVAPIPGDTYAVTAGAQSGARFTCYVGGAWNSSLGGAGFALPTPIPFTLASPDLAPQPADPWFDQGVILFDPALYAYLGAASQTLALFAAGQVTRGAGALFGDVQLYDLTNLAVLATLLFGTVGYSNQGQGFVMPASPVLLLVRSRCRAPAGTIPGDFLNLRGASIQIANTF